jgi:hypothetical protein
MSPCKTIGGAQRVVVKPATRWVLHERHGAALVHEPVGIDCRIVRVGSQLAC